MNVTVTRQNAAVFLDTISAKKARLSGRTMSGFIPGSGSMVAKNLRGVNQMVAAITIKTNPNLMKMIKEINFEDIKNPSKGSFDILLKKNNK